ncbi:CatB-related O-acetyltransferase [Burkholderia sp. A9]|uniref:CatB-related O-acetyltransferase n=1 Tax=Burkholderia sp. A9 TaxID=1365108 RepID=UPI0009DE01FC|nr:CatB-related O-acetyltransferase [Burkholderia sp. A9]
MPNGNSLRIVRTTCPHPERVPVIWHGRHLLTAAAQAQRVISVRDMVARVLAAHWNAELLPRRMAKRAERLSYKRRNSLHSDFRNMRISATEVTKFMAHRHALMWRKAPASNHAAKAPDTLSVPRKVRIEPHCRMAVFDELYSIGSFSYCQSALPGFVSMGRYCSIASGVSVLGPNHPYERVTTSPFTYDRLFSDVHAAAKPNGAFTISPLRSQKNPEIEIGHDVWIGDNVMVARGVKIGTGAIIAGNSHVVKDVAPYTIVGGNPARPIKDRFPSQSLIADLQESKWWKYNFFDLNGMDFEQPSVFIDQLKNRALNGEIQPYEPVAIEFSDLSALTT